MDAGAVAAEEDGERDGQRANHHHAQRHEPRPPEAGRRRTLGVFSPLQTDGKMYCKSDAIYI